MFQIGDVIRSIPVNGIFDTAWEGVIVATKQDDKETYYEIDYFDKEAREARFLLVAEMEKLNDAS